MQLWIPKFNYIPPRKRKEARPVLRLPLYKEQAPVYSQEDEKKEKVQRGVIEIQM